ncbi:MAG: tetratricopeptide repeat protein, partial [Myxococcales bacterium]
PGTPPGADTNAPHPRQPHQSHYDGAPPAARPGTAASVTVASMLEAEVPESTVEGHQPLRLDQALSPLAEVKPARLRTLTAARGGQIGTPAAKRPPLLSRRVMLMAGGATTFGAAIVATLVLDLPDRLRGEPARAAALGSTAAAIAQDHFSAFSEGARLLEEAAGTRRHAMATRADAAALLACSVVIHGGDRGRIARAEALLEVKKEPGDPAHKARVRALAWVALAKGRWREAEQLAADNPSLPGADASVLRGWAAMGRDDAGHALQQFQAAVAGSPPAVTPFPSHTAALYGLARAREATLSAETESAYRAVLAAAPAHVGAALGMARVSKLSPAGRLKLAEAVIAQQGNDASRLELAEAQVLIARAAYELGSTEKVTAALKRAREVDPGSAAAAVLGGDMLLAEGRTDEAVGLYKLVLAAPVSASRSGWLKVARLAALIESGRRNEATAALAELERGLPGDARVSFWRGRAAERAEPADLVAADQAYRESLTRDPRFLPASLQLARMLLDQHRTADALNVLRRAEKAGAAAARLRLALGQALLVSGNAPEAVRTFRQAIAADPRGALPAAHLGLAAALEAQGDLEGARTELAALSARADAAAGLGARVAVVLVKLGRKEEALAAYRKEVTGGTATAQTKVAAARLALELGRNEEARALAQAAVDEDPRTSGALLVLAEVRRAGGDLPRALVELRRALAVDGSPEVQLEYGRALSALGRDEDALAALSQAQDLPEAAVERGRILLRRGDAEAASKQLGAATARLPAHAEAFLLLGDAEDRLGHALRAEAAWRTAVKLAPTSAEARYRLGRLEMDRGQAAAALPQLRAAADHLPGRELGRDKPAATVTATTGAAPAVPAPAPPAWRADLFFQLGFAELRQGARDRALLAFKRYLEIAPADAPARAEVNRQVSALASVR